MKLPKLDNLKDIQLSDQEAGSVYAEIASLYLRTSNALLKNYVSFLKDIVKELQKFI